MPPPLGAGGIMFSGCPSVRPYYTSKQMYNWMKWLWLLGGWHFIAATAIKPLKAACQFAADDILLYEFCYYNPMNLLHHLEKGKEELSPLQYHIKSLHIISRHYKKSLLRSQIYHGYEELSTDTNYPIWRRQERRSKYAVQLASWQLRSNSPKTSVCPSVHASGEVSRHLPENAWSEWSEILHVDVSWAPSELIVIRLWSWSVDFPPFLASLWLSEMGQIWGFRAFPWERMVGMAWNFACWCISTTFRTD